MILLSILSIILSISSELTLKIVSLTRDASSLKVSLVIFFWNASLFSHTVSVWKKFSIGLRSGLRGAIFNTSAFTLSIASIATFEFCLGHPSMRNLLALEFDDLLNAYGKDLTISANFGPVIVPSYCSQRTTPLPYDYCHHEVHVDTTFLFSFCGAIELQAFSPFSPLSSSRCACLVIRVTFVLESLSIQIKRYPCSPELVTQFLLSNFLAKLYP